MSLVLKYKHLCVSWYLLRLLSWLCINVLVDYLVEIKSDTKDKHLKFKDS